MIKRSIPNLILLFLFNALSLTEMVASEYKDVAQKIHRAVEQLHTLRSNAFRERERLQEQIPDLKQNIERLEDDLSSVSDEIRILQNEIDKINQGIGTTSKSVNEMETFFHNAAIETKAVVEEMRSRIRKGIPYKRDVRFTRLEEILAGCSSNDANRNGDSLVEFWTFAGEEFRISKSNDVWKESIIVESEQKKVHGDMLRFGLVNQAFVSEDGIVIGLSDGQSEDDWKFDLTDNHQQLILEALKIVQKQLPPKLVGIPFSTTPGRPEK